MKIQPAPFSTLLLAFGITALAADARAQSAATTETRTKTTTTEPAPAAPAVPAAPATVVRGTFTEYVGATKSVLVKTEAAPAPVSYLINDATSIVDEAGTPVELATLADGSAVAVEYSQVGPAMMASRIVVRKAAPAGTTTTAVRTVDGRPLTELQKGEAVKNIEKKQEQLEELKEKLEK